MKVKTLAGLAVLAIAAGPAYAGHGHGGLEACLEAASEVKPGSYVKVEYLAYWSGGEPAYEIEVRDADGVEWELMCEADDGRIVELEREVDSADDPLFSAKAKVSEADAVKAAQAMFPGKVKEVEYEIETDGSPTYEIDIVDKTGKEYKVEVSAVTGEIVETAYEAWEIGEEAGEGR